MPLLPKHGNGPQILPEHTPGSPFQSIRVARANSSSTPDQITLDRLLTLFPPLYTCTVSISTLHDNWCAYVTKLQQIGCVCVCLCTCRGWWLPPGPWIAHFPSHEGSIMFLSPLEALRGQSWSLKSRPLLRGVASARQADSLTRQKLNDDCILGTMQYGAVSKRSWFIPLWSIWGSVNGTFNFNKYMKNCEMQVQSVNSFTILGKSDIWAWNE